MQLDAMNCKQEGNAQRRTHPIASKWEMPARSRVQSRAKKEMLKGSRVQLRANGKCSKEGPPNCEQKEFARRRTRPIAILNIGGCGYAPIGGFPDRTTQQHIQVFLT